MTSLTVINTNYQQGLALFNNDQYELSETKIFNSMKLLETITNQTDEYFEIKYLHLTLYAWIQKKTKETWFKKLEKFQK